MQSWAVTFTSLKGSTKGSVVTERYETQREAMFVASLMRANGHLDAVVAAA